MFFGYLDDVCVMFPANVKVFCDAYRLTITDLPTSTPTARIPFMAFLSAFNALVKIVSYGFNWIYTSVDPLMEHLDFR